MSLVTKVLDAMNDGVLPYHPLRTNTGFPVVDKLADRLISTFFDAIPGGDVMQWLLEHAPVFKDRERLPDQPGPSGPVANQYSQGYSPDFMSGHISWMFIDVDRQYREESVWDFDPVTKAGSLTREIYRATSGSQAYTQTFSTKYVLTPYICGSSEHLRLHVYYRETHTDQASSNVTYDGWSTDYSMTLPPPITSYSNGQPNFDLLQVFRVYDLDQLKPNNFYPQYCGNFVVISDDDSDLVPITGVLYPLSDYTFWFHYTSHEGAGNRARLSSWLRNLRKERRQFGFRLDTSIPPVWNDTFGDLESPDWYQT